MKIPVENIYIKEGRREVNARHVQELAESIQELGLLNPITVDKGHTLIAGFHRLEAVKLLEWPEIECTVSSLEGLQAELAEIDENLVRHDLNFIEEGEQLARRKEIYETLHPETRQGKRNGQTSKTETVSVLEVKPFAEDTAEKIGVAARTVRNKIQVAKNLTPEVKEIAKENKIGFKNAVKLSRLEPEQQKEAAELLAANEIKSVDEYNAVRQEARTLEPPDIANQEPKESIPVPDVPYTLPDKRFATIKESVDDLKDPDKDCSCTADSFLAEFSAFVQKFDREIKWYHNPYYQVVYPSLTQVQLDYLHQQTDSICSAVEAFYHEVERKHGK